MAQQETNILNKWRLKWNKFAILFRNQVGMLWAGYPIDEWEENGVKFCTLKNAYKMQVGIKGRFDYDGWHSMTVTPEMVGKKVAIYTAVEGKTPDGRLSDEQRIFLMNVRKAGGIAFVVRDENDRPGAWESTE